MSDLLEDSHGSFPAEEPRVDSHRGKAIQGKEFGWRYVTVLARSGLSPFSLFTFSHSTLLPSVPTVTINAYREVISGST